MFQIGESLREARQRRGLELAEVAQATKVRERYLRALEEERFDELPAGGYRKTFLRGYATYLGLDANAFVDEYVSRFEKPESVEIELAPPVRRRRRPVRWMWPAAGAAALAIGLIAWLAPASEHPADQPTAKPATAAAPKPAATHTSPPSLSSARPNRERAVRVVFAAASGDCWLLIRRGGAQAQPVYERILAQGQVLTLRASKLWVRIGNPAVLTLTVNGQAQALPTQTGNVIVDQTGVHFVG